MLMGVISVLGEVELFRADRLSRCRPAVGTSRGPRSGMRGGSRACGDDADIALPAAQVTAVLGHADDGQDQTVVPGAGGDRRWHGFRGVPQGDVEVGVTLRESGAAVVAHGVRRGGGRVGGAVEASAGGDAPVGRAGYLVGDVEPGAGAGFRVVVQAAPGVRDGGPACVQTAKSRPGGTTDGRILLGPARSVRSCSRSWGRPERRAADHQLSGSDHLPLGKRSSQRWDVPDQAHSRTPLTLGVTRASMLACALGAQPPTGSRECRTAR